MGKSAVEKKLCFRPRGKFDLKEDACLCVLW